MADFTSSLLRWYRKSGRHDLPWQQDPNPYRVWVSEIMLQQTQVRTVIPYYQRFMLAFPDVETLAEANIDEVLHLWTGLGYYARARNLHRSAIMISQEYDGVFPDTLETLKRLPGIGRSTAGAILALSANKPVAILDGNVKRVLSRYHGVFGWPGTRKVEEQLWKLAEEHTPVNNAAEYTQAIMDLGATLCVRGRPDCGHCPVKTDCWACIENLQQRLPEKKPGKKLPVRHTKFAIVENLHGEVLLEKRPPAGVWGGLWGFPECAAEDDAESWLDNERGFSTSMVREQPVIRHTFSHFHLEIIPVNLKLRSAVNRVEDNLNQCWYKPDGSKKLGMAAPVKKLVDEFFLTGTGEKQ